MYSIYISTPSEKYLRIFQIEKLEQKSRTLFIGNLPENSKQQEIKNLFEKDVRIQFNFFLLVIPP